MGSWYIDITTPGSLSQGLVVVLGGESCGGRTPTTWAVTQRAVVVDLRTLLWKYKR